MLAAVRTEDLAPGLHQLLLERTEPFRRQRGPHCGEPFGLQCRDSHPEPLARRHTLDR